MLDLAIKNGTIITESDSFKADIGVENKKIAIIAAPNTLENGKETIDAEGKYVMPGMIEPHMHVAAPFGGTIDVLDFYSARKLSNR